MPEESSPGPGVGGLPGPPADLGSPQREVQATIGAAGARPWCPTPRVNVLCHQDDEALARQLCGERNTHFVHAVMDDIWLRDTGGVFVQDEQGGSGWWTSTSTAGVTSRSTAMTPGRLPGGPGRPMPITCLSRLIGEGRHRVDSNGTAIMTENSWISSNRNPASPRRRWRRSSRPTWGCKIIWLPGIRARDITDAHVDFYARFVRPGWW